MKVQDCKKCKHCMIRNNATGYGNGNHYHYCTKYTLRCSAVKKCSILGARK